MQENIIQILDKKGEEFEQNSNVDPIEPLACLKLKALIETVISYCGKKVWVNNNEEVFLRWRHVKTYLEQYTPNDEHLYSHIISVFAEKYKRSFTSENSIWKIDFDNDIQSARAFKLFLEHILPYEKPNFLNFHPSIFYLSDGVMFFYSRYFTDDNGKIFAHFIHDTLLKTLRADRFDFSRQFILGLIPGEKNQRRLSNLRPKNRLPYVITPAGQVELRHQKRPLLTPHEKQGFTQAQSCTLIGDVQSPAFGFSKDRIDTLYGLITDLDDAHVQRMLMNDGGTVSRLFDCENVQAAYIRLATFGKKINHSSDKKVFSPDEVRLFKKQNSLREKWGKITNELLARLRFNPFKSIVCICADKLEARLLAHDFAEELWEDYRAYNTKRGIHGSSEFSIPIVFYTPAQKEKENESNGISNHLRFYTEQMFRQDQAECEQVYLCKDGDSRHALYIFRHYEFLLGLKEITLEILTEEIEEKGEKTILAIHMIKNGYVRLLMRLLRPPRSKPSLKNELISHFIKSGLIHINIQIITEFILIEEFEVADRLIKATGFCKTYLKSNDEFLVNVIFKKGNPRQMNYMGLDSMLAGAALANHCSIIKLCLKEFNISDQKLLNVLLNAACRNQEHTLARMVLERGATIFGDGTITPMRLASDSQDWEMVKLLAKRPSDERDTAQFGYALLKAFEFDRMEVVLFLLERGPRPFWRNKTNADINKSTVFYAIIHRSVSHKQLMQLIDYELEYIDNRTIERICFEYIAAYEINSDVVRKTLDDKYRSFFSVKEHDVLFKACLQDRFEKITRHNNMSYYNNIKQLLKFNPKINDENAKIIFGLASSFKDAPLMKSLMFNREFSEDAREEFVMFSMGYNVLSTEELIAYIREFNITVKVCHLRRAVTLNLSKTFLFFLHRLRFVERVTTTLIWDTYPFFRYERNQKSNLYRPLLRAFGKNLVLEHILIHVVEFFHRSYIWPESDWPAVRKIEEQIDKIDHVQSLPIALQGQLHKDVMIQLNNYFTFATAPNEAMAENTLNRVFKLFEKVKDSGPLLGFFVEKDYATKFNFKVYDFLKRWKKHLHDYELELIDAENHNLLLSDNSYPEAKLVIGGFSV